MGEYRDCRRGSRLWALALWGLLSLLLAGCGGGTPSPEGETLALPDTLKLTAELPEEYPGQAKTYTANWLEVEEDRAVQTLFRGEGGEWLQWAQGRQLLAKGEDISESLLIYGGEIKGGLIYSYRHHADEGGGPVVKNEPGYPQMTTQQYGYDDMQDYAEEGDLSFKSRAEASKEIEELLYACGFPPLALQRSYVLDAETMNEHQALYNRVMREDSEEFREYEYTEEDEGYLFHFRQVLDGIPFANLIWSKGTRDEGTETVLYSKYGRNGSLTINAWGVYEIGKPVSEDAVISPEEAIEAYAAEYRKALHSVETEIFGVELNYIVVYNAAEMYAKPAWILSSRYKEEYEEAGETLEYYEYEVTAVSAVTGALIQGETDLR